MTEIVEVTERCNEIRSHAEALRAPGELDYFNLKKRASCGGDVAQRIMKALKAEGPTGVEAAAPPPRHSSASSPSRTRRVGTPARRSSIALRSTHLMRWPPKLSPA
jgi:hypothetical protein